MQTTTNAHDLSAMPLALQDAIVSDTYEQALTLMDACPGDVGPFVRALIRALDEPTPTEQLAAISAVVGQMKARHDAA